jgi:hypothetical protein
LTSTAFPAAHGQHQGKKNGQISVVGKGLADQFNAKLKNSRDLRNKMRDANQRMASAQSAGMQKLGIGKSDLGLEKP